MKKFSIIKEGSINLVLNNNFPKISKGIEKKISSIWEKNSKDNVRLENNRILFLQRINEYNNTIEVDRKSVV